MKIKFLFVFCLLSISSSLYAIELHGAGATFPALVYQQWANNYTIRKDMKVDYLAVGSGEGIKRIKAREVDFGGTDMPLTMDELNKNELIQFPTMMGAITPVINLPGVYICVGLRALSWRACSAADLGWHWPYLVAGGQPHGLYPLSALRDLALRRAGDAGL